MIFIFNIINTILVIVYFYLSWSILYFFTFSLASLFRRKIKNTQVDKIRKMAVLIPAYKEDAVIYNVAKKALLQKYPGNKFEVIVIADSLLPSTVIELKKLRIKVIEIDCEERTKANALNHAMHEIGDNYDVAVVLDADNEMCSDFLHQINQAFSNGYSAVQGHRIGKNKNNSYAILDCISEEINNSIFRQGHRALGFSSAFIGSGLAVEYSLYKRIMKYITSVGEDKELELALLLKRYKIEYLPEAYVLDEKVQNTEVMQKQRSRWLYAQFHFLKTNFFRSFVQLFKGNFDFFDKVMQQILPPRSILIGVSGIILIQCFIFSLSIVDVVNEQNFTLPLWSWLLLVSVFYLALLLAIPAKLFNNKMLKALISLPRGIIIMLLSLINLKKANKTFVHTPHVFNEEEEV